MSPTNGEKTPSREAKESRSKAFLSKLRKRRIIETLAAFIAGGWLIMEFVHFILIGHYHFPDKTLDITFITLICVLLCTLIWRWFSGREKPRIFNPGLVLIPLVVLITILLDINFLLHLKGPESETIPASKWKNSIAVLPFVDMSPQKDQEYFCDGMTEELINRLSNIRELKVPARTSVFMLTGKAQDIQEVGQKLKVNTVLEGSVRKAGNELRITAQLINIADGYHLWSEVYDRELKDVFAIQDEIALAVADKLKLTLLGDEKAKLGKHHEIVPAAYEAYLKGLYYWWQWSEEGATNALRHFRRAIEIEPNYAPAHAGMALVIITGSGWLQIWPPREGVPKGKEIAQKAIELDPTLADGYIALGQALMNFDWDWAGAEKALKKALELNPNSPLALDSYTNFLAMQGRFDEAVVVQKRALELDPLSAGLWHDLGWIYFESGQFDQAIPHLRKALELDRDLHVSRHELGLSYLWTGKTAEALAEHQILAQLAPNLPWVQGALGYFFALTGRPAEARKALADLDQLASKRYVPCWARAIVYLGLGQKSLALDWLEKACEEHDGWMWDLNVCPWYGSLRNEPRFKVLLKRVGFGK